MPLRFFSGCLLWLDGVKIFIVLSLSLFLEFQVSICIDSLLLKEAFMYVKGFHIFVSVIEAFGVGFGDEWRKMLRSIIYGCLETKKKKNWNFQWSFDKKFGLKFLNLVLIFWLMHRYYLCCIWLLHAFTLVACSSWLCRSSFVCIY